MRHTKHAFCSFNKSLRLKNDDVKTFRGLIGYDARIPPCLTAILICFLKIRPVTINVDEQDMETANLRGNPKSFANLEMADKKRWVLRKRNFNVKAP